MPKNHVIHARITDESYHKLSKICNDIGCSKTDYVISLLDNSFDEEPSEIEPEPLTKKRPEPIPEPSVEIIPEKRIKFTFPDGTWRYV